MNVLSNPEKLLKRIQFLNRHKNILLKKAYEKNIEKVLKSNNLELIIEVGSILEKYNFEEKSINKI